MTVGYAAFWIYLAACSTAAGITAVVLGLIARFAVRPFDTNYRLGMFLGLFGVVVLVSACASALAFYLATQAGAFVSFRLSCLISPLLGGVVVFIWASGFPLSRILPRRG
jgi:hypothetical protein